MVFTEGSHSNANKGIVKGNCMVCGDRNYCRKLFIRLHVDDKKITPGQTIETLGFICLKCVEAKRKAFHNPPTDMSHITLKK